MADARRAPLKDQTDIKGARALIVEARFYDDIQDALLEGAVAELKAAGLTHDVITVPGALEIPAAIAIAIDAAEKNGKPYDAAIALGCVVRGDTIHFEIVSIESSRALMEGAVAELKAAGLTHDVITVPGALEVPAAIAIALDAAENNGKPYDAAIALGCVVRGDTIHFEIVSIESSRALMDLAVARKVPLGNGIITVNTEAQAWARARASELNKGGDAARAALAMLRIKRRLAKA